MLETSRLILRQWRYSDYEPFYELNANPDVMKYFPSTLIRDESDMLADRFRATIETNNGWGFWAVEEKNTSEFVGCVGLAHQPERFDFSPCTEVGWRLRKEFWHLGMAYEAAGCALSYAFDVLNLEEVVSFTSKHNLPSENLMKRLGMVKQGHFMHPALPAEHHLAEHVLYKINGTK